VFPVIFTVFLIKFSCIGYSDHTRSACMVGLVRQIDINEFLSLSRDELLCRFPGGYEVVLPPNDQSAILDRYEWFYDPFAQVKQLLSQPGWLREKGSEWVLSFCISKVQEIADLFVSTFYNLDVMDGTKLEFEIPDQWMVPCFYHRRTTKSLRQIIQAIYPNLHFEGRQDKSDRTRNSTKHTFSIPEPLTAGRLDIQVSREEFSSLCRYTFTFHGSYFWVKHQQRERRNHEELKMRGLLRTLAMGIHDRLGARSELKSLSADIFRKIGSIALNSVTS
jgi:hypothetical protein